MGGCTVVVTAEYIQRAKLCGACSDLPATGTTLSELTYGQLAWADEQQLLTASEIKAVIGRSDIPLALLASSGSGSGYGDGDGYGYGYGK